MIQNDFYDRLSNYSIQQDAPSSQSQIDSEFHFENFQQFNQYYFNAMHQSKSIFKIQRNSIQIKSNKLLKGKLINYNRREKSLEQLSRKFLSFFLEFEDKIMELDKITHLLGVQRRRIYDIINILQSLKVVNRNGKNQYRWNGIKKIIETIEQYELMGNSGNNINKKEKSLQFLSIGFLKLFLNWKTIMGLQEAAKKLVGDIEPQKLKTKIRRLYDIANVFKSLGLLKKTNLPNRKPGFQWLGVCGMMSYLNIKFENLGYDQMENSSSKQLSIMNQRKHSSFFQQFLMHEIVQKNTVQTFQSFMNTWNNCLWPKQNQKLEKRSSINDLVFQTNFKSDSSLKDITNTNTTISKKGFGQFKRTGIQQKLTFQ